MRGRHRLIITCFVHTQLHLFAKPLTGKVMIYLFTSINIFFAHVIRDGWNRLCSLISSMSYTNTSTYHIRPTYTYYYFILDMNVGGGEYLRIWRFEDVVVKVRLGGQGWKRRRLKEENSPTSHMIIRIVFRKNQHKPHDELFRTMVWVLFSGNSRTHFLQMLFQIVFNFSFRAQNHKLKFLTQSLFNNE